MLDGVGSPQAKALDVLEGEPLFRIEGGSPSPEAVWGEMFGFEPEERPDAVEEKPEGFLVFDSQKAPIPVEEDGQALVHWVA